MALQTTSTATTPRAARAPGQVTVGQDRLGKHYMYVSGQGRGRRPLHLDNQQKKQLARLGVRRGGGAIPIDPNSANALRLAKSAGKTEGHFNKGSTKPVDPELASKILDAHKAWFQANKNSTPQDAAQRLDTMLSNNRKQWLEQAGKSPTDAHKAFAGAVLGAIFGKGANPGKGSGAGFKVSFSPGGEEGGGHITLKSDGGGTIGSVKFNDLSSLSGDKILAVRQHFAAAMEKHAGHTPDQPAKETYAPKDQEGASTPKVKVPKSKQGPATPSATEKESKNIHNTFTMPAGSVDVSHKGDNVDFLSDFDAASHLIAKKKDVGLLDRVMKHTGLSKANVLDHAKAVSQAMDAAKSDKGIRTVMPVPYGSASPKVVEKKAKAPATPKQKAKNEVNTQAAAPKKQENTKLDKNTTALHAAHVAGSTEHAGESHPMLHAAAQVKKRGGDLSDPQKFAAFAQEYTETVANKVGKSRVNSYETLLRKHAS